jgi:hypothetical protein
MKFAFSGTLESASQLLLNKISLSTDITRTGCCLYEVNATYQRLQLEWTWMDGPVQLNRTRIWMEIKRTFLDENFKEINQILFFG